MGRPRRRRRRSSPGSCAAAVDKRASLRERRLLAHAASALGVEHDEARVDRMIQELEEIGVLRQERSPAGVVSR
ncbi:hypothetical protein ACMHYB_00350 [Sorangium sp. So ce1128]